MQRSTLVCLLALPLASGSGAEPAEVLGLDQAVQIALENGFPVVDATLEVEMRSESVAAAKTRRFPVMEVFASETRHLTDEAFSVDAGTFGSYPIIGPVPATETEIATQPGWATVAGARAVLPLSEQYEIGLAIEQEEVAHGLAGQDLRLARQRLAKDVKDAYYGIIETQAAIEAAGESLVFLRELDELVRRYVEVEVALAYESLEVDSRLAAAEQDLRVLRSELATEMENLNRLLGRALETPFAVSGTLDLPGDTLDAARARADALANRPDVLAAGLEVERAETAYRIEGADFIPKINLVASYLRPFDTEFVPDEFAQIGLEARWEFFSWGRRTDQLAEKRAAIRKAKNQERSTRTQVALEVNGQLRTLLDSEAAIPVAELAERAAEEKLQVMMNRYREQAVLLERVLEAESDLAAARAGVRIAKLQALSAQADLERAMGEE